MNIIFKTSIFIFLTVPVAPVSFYKCAVNFYFPRKVKFFSPVYKLLKSPCIIQYNNQMKKYLIGQCIVLFSCSSRVGYQGTRQLISLGRGCMHHGIIVHEIGL